MLSVAKKMCLQFSSALFIAEVVVSRVERQPVSQMWSGGDKAPVTITTVCAWNRTHPDVGRIKILTT